MLDLDPVRPAEKSPDRARRSFTRGRGHPRGTAWFGFRSLWGHTRHFLAAAIATEDVDSRDWMRPDDPAELCRRVLASLGGDPEGRSVVEGLGRDLWIDYVADTGDDAEVSGAVARLVFQPYSLPAPGDEGSWLTAPRGEVLLFGGDTAYPVATASEIHDRLVVPWNRALRDLDADDRPRVLLGIPGNHDWYDGLDGFARMFREPMETADTEDVEPPVEPLREGRIEKALEFAGSFLTGGQVEKTKALVLAGYRPVQHASYFALALAPGLHLWAVDRQLRTIDFRQRQFFRRWRHRNPEARRVLVLPDPVFSFCQPNRHGMGMVERLGLDLVRDAHLVLSGDIHHYQRFPIGQSTHVTAGGGGAFLHPAPLRVAVRPDVEWPGPRQSASLLGQIPVHVGLGRSGLIPHVIFGLLYAPAFGVGAFTAGRGDGLALASIASGVLSTLVFLVLGGVRRSAHKTMVAVLSLAAGVLTGALPALGARAFGHALEHWQLGPAPWMSSLLALLLTMFVGAFVFGAYFASSTWLGLENYQAFTALGHPGYKHFVRLRVRANGEAIDAWCIGMQDPLGKGEEPVLVDRFTWRGAGRG